MIMLINFKYQFFTIVKINKNYNLKFYLYLVFNYMEITQINKTENIQLNFNEHKSLIKNNENLKKQKKLYNDDFFDEIQQKNENIIKNENDINENYKELKQEFNNFLENVLSGTTKIKNIIKKLDKQIQKNDNVKEKQQNKKNLLSKEKGFAETKNIPKSIKLFFDLDEETKMARTKVGGLFQDYLKKNNLKGNMNEKNKIDKRIYKFDDKLTKLFNVTEQQKNKINSCTSSKTEYPNGYNFYNYQTWIKKLYEEENINNNKDNKLYTEII